MEKTYFKTVGLLYFQDHKLLLVRAFGKDAFLLPGGKIETNETKHQALIREVKEELNVDLMPNSLQLYNIIKAKAYRQLKNTFVHIHCFTGKFVGIPKPAREIEELQYFSYTEYANSTVVPAGEILFELLKKDGLID